ncbi:MAG: hypothetical protein ACLFWR_09510 [Acidimicrobiales bacterium]
MLIFVYTIGIGILNGLDLVEFSRQQLLSHLHGGTLGWMTLAIIGATQWLFVDQGAAISERSARTVRWFAYLAAIAIPLYVLAFATTFGIGRPLGGTATLIALIGIAVWSFGRVREVMLTVPRLLILLGLTSSVIGGGFGVLNGFAIAFGWTWVSESLFEAHPGTMEIGFTMPVAMALAEWGMRIGTPDEKPNRWGIAQASLMLVAFVWVLGFILAGQEELVGIGIMFGIVAIAIFFGRMRRFVRNTPLTVRAPGRHALAGGVLLGVTMVYIFLAISAVQGDFAAMPRGQALSFIHLLAIGSTTNALLAFVTHLSRRVSDVSTIDDVIFWGVNIGLIGFVVALTTDVRGLIVVFVPIMGLALLVAIGAHLLPLGNEPASTPTAAT